LSLTLEIQVDEYHLGLLPLGPHDKVVGRAPSELDQQLGRVPQQEAGSVLRKDANKGGAKPSKTAKSLPDDPKAATSMPPSEEPEAHMVPEESILRTLEEIRADHFYLIVYVAAKSEEEQKSQQQVSNSAINLIIGTAQIKYEEG
jgi:hypothetical protein